MKTVTSLILFLISSPVAMADGPTLPEATQLLVNQDFQCTVAENSHRDHNFAYVKRSGTISQYWETNMNHVLSSYQIESVDLSRQTFRTNRTRNDAGYWFTVVGVMSSDKFLVYSGYQAGSGETYFNCSLL